MADPLIVGFPDVTLWTGDIIALAYRDKKTDPRYLMRNAGSVLKLDNSAAADTNNTSCRYLVKTIAQGEDQSVFALAPQNTDGPLYVGFTDDGSKLVPKSSDPNNASVTKFVAQ